MRDILLVLISALMSVSLSVAILILYDAWRQMKQPHFVTLNLSRVMRNVNSRVNKNTEGLSGTAREKEADVLFWEYMRKLKKYWRIFLRVKLSLFGRRWLTERR